MEIRQLNVVAQAAHEIDLVILLEVGAKQDVVQLSWQFGIGVSEPVGAATGFLFELTQCAVVSVFWLAALFASFGESPVGFGPGRRRQGGQQIVQGMIGCGV